VRRICERMGLGEMAPDFGRKGNVGRVGVPKWANGIACYYGMVLTSF
jgi:hypothetical protein